MRPSKILHVLLLLLMAFTGCDCYYGQDLFSIEGKIINEDNEPVPFAHIRNFSTHKGTISNSEGYFRINASSLNDTILITFIGFKDHLIQLEPEKLFYPIKLEKNVELLGVLTVTPDENDYLFELIRECKKKIKYTPYNSKAYYELKSYIDNKQIELVEEYCNAEIKGFLLKELYLKAGRLALKQQDDRFFASLESSRALLMLDVINKNDRFPTDPLGLTPVKLKKEFNLTLDRKYSKDNSTIYVVDYAPKDPEGDFFNGKLWIDETNKVIIKMTLNSKAKSHPFFPIFSNDKILGVDLQITETFKNINQEGVFNHMDFIYTTDYKSRDGKEYTIKTKAVLYAYDYQNLFFLPIFEYNQYAFGDYPKINALPYNEFFWKYNDEYRVHDSLNSNDQFYNDSLSITNQDFYRSLHALQSKFYKHPYMTWSAKRKIFRQSMPGNFNSKIPHRDNSEHFNLVTKVFLDINHYGDSTDVMTATIFDFYDSYYYYPLYRDRNSHCFINMYLDYSELQRRELYNTLISGNYTQSEVWSIYRDFEKKFFWNNFQFIEEVKHGTNETAMRLYNDTIKEHLGIDNLDIFKPKFR